MKNRPQQDVYVQMQRFADLTKANIALGNISRAKKLLNRAEDIFKNSNNQVKNAILNIYIFSVSTFMEIHHCSVRNLFPEMLKEEYYKQVNSSCI